MAIRALHTAASGMKAMQTNVDTIANNLANATTVGFKRDRIDFADLLYQQVRRPGILTPLGNRTPVGMDIGTGVKVTAVTKEYEVGSPQFTGQDFDMMIDGPGFFQIEMQNGQTAYTRNGQFKRDSVGNLVTNEGYKLFPAITVPDNAVRFEVSKDGRVQGWDAQNQQVVDAQIQLAYIPNQQGLEPIGENLFLANQDATGPIQTGNPTNPGFGQILDGFLEGSNVDVVRSMVDLIKAQRAYEFNSNAIRTSDSMLQQAASLVR
ncbi:MAG: flagellar basal-body rod protein FlgG [Planctomycetes bacterium]|nr:flagellar basal-body rod protein FlgG [Planctomycetota bacterium]